MEFGLANQISLSVLFMESILKRNLTEDIFFFLNWIWIDKRLLPAPSLVIYQPSLTFAPF